MNTAYWIDYFTARRGTYEDPDWSRPCGIADPARRVALAKSLAVLSERETRPCIHFSVCWLAWSSDQRDSGSTASNPID